jgi:AIG2 family protein
MRIIGIALLSSLVAITIVRSVYICYALAVLAAGCFAHAVGNWLYLAVFILGMLTALAEVISKFRDEPLKSLRTPHAVLYHILNGVIAAFGLYVYQLSVGRLEADQERLKAVIVAGFGSMLLMRSKLFNIKMDGEDVSFGPEQIVRVFFSFMEGAIDRVRAQSRIDFVLSTLENIDFDHALPYCLTMLQASQTLGDKERSDLEIEIEKLKKATTDKQLRSYRLGFLLLNVGGEAYVAKLFSRIPVEWRIKAPAPPGDAGGNGLLGLILAAPRAETTLPYLAYGSSMSTARFRQRLNWLGPESTKWLERTKAKPAKVEGYRLEFNRADPECPSRGMANITIDPTEKIEGVVYQLTPEALQFLDRAEEGTRRVKLMVEVGGKKLEAHSFVADDVDPNLSPSPEYLKLLLNGAREHGLSRAYIAQLERQVSALSAGAGPRSTPVPPSSAPSSSPVDVGAAPPASALEPRGAPMVTARAAAGL